MIEFEDVTYQNFMSVGNAPIHIKLNERQLTLIAGTNGNGKSIVIEAITFGLYGKAFRDIAKKQLINSINQKQCLVTINFNIAGIKYRVERGIKPDVFRIFKNGELINQEAARDYQKILEQQILGISYRVFTQVVLLGSATFTPFMKLTTAARREVIDDILDIRIITRMNGLLKEAVKKNKQNIIAGDSSIRAQTDLIKAQQRLIDTILSNEAQQQEDISEKIENIKAEIFKSQAQFDENKQTLDKLRAQYDEKIGIKDVLKNVNQDIQTNTVLSNSKLELKNKLTALDVCPTCLQSVDVAHVEKLCEKINTEMVEHDTMLHKLGEQKAGLLKEALELKNLSDTISSVNSEQALLNNSIQNLNKQITSTTPPKTHSSQKETEKLRELVQRGSELVLHKNELMDVKTIHDVAATLLDDSGVKAAIIKEYLPVMNNLINGYLQEMDSYVSFTFDESFNEKITSRHRDLFTYSSFSEGEKARINIAILFCWREIARLKNSVHTNLLFMDEIVDSSMDYEGITSVVGMLEKLNGNVFVISHRQESHDKFPHVIEFEKVGDFTKIKDE